MVKEKKKVDEIEVKSEEVKPKRSNKELYWVLGVMVGLIGVFLVGSFIFSGLNKFEYEGFAFNEERFGEIPVFHHSYLINHPLTGNVIKYNFFLRNDPRENDVPVEGEGSIEFLPGKYTYIAIDGHGFEQCPQSTLAVASLSEFLTNNGVSVKGATTRLIEAEKNDLQFATCDSKPERVVIEIRVGEETKIVKESTMCHKITVADCDILKAIEKFEIQTLIEARERAIASIN
tara:strand:+ start:2345 stop:3040 length:696 start_codon:yes stop_codon:yes gene_type:complete